MSRVYNRVIVTGGAGFIGSAVIRNLLLDSNITVCNVDKLTYAANTEQLKLFERSENYQFFHLDICDVDRIKSLFEEFMPDTIIHLAAESHVDNSINSPDAFLMTNIMGTASLLNASQKYLQRNPVQAENFRFHHVSTDEVFGSLNECGRFTELSNYDPSSPYSASKASSDHLVRAWGRTYGIPYTISNCSNNYGPNQNFEKLIPKVIYNVLHNIPIPVYGNGKNVRDWLHVDDHVSAIRKIIEYGAEGETYNIGSDNELSNLEIIGKIVKEISRIQNLSPAHPLNLTDFIEYVPDRLGHDFRYSIDASKLRRELKWFPQYTFDDGIAETVKWYYNDYSRK